jgi:hypothetical protein
VAGVLLNPAAISEHGGVATCFEVQQEGTAAMPQSPEERAARYRNYAAFLRLVADRTSVDTARARLRRLAEQFDRLGASIQSATFAA